MSFYIRKPGFMSIWEDTKDGKFSTLEAAKNCAIGNGYKMFDILDDSAWNGPHIVYKHR